MIIKGMKKRSKTEINDNNERLSIPNLSSQFQKDFEKINKEIILFCQKYATPTKNCTNFDIETSKTEQFLNMLQEIANKTVFSEIFETIH